MKRIRIGKDISMRWEITTDGEAIPLEGRDLTVEIKSPMGIENNIPYRVDGNILIMTYYGYEQKRTGEYSITLWEKKGKPGQNVVDVIRAFKLVETSQEEDDFVGGDLQVESVDLGTENFDILTEGGYRSINIDTLQAEALEDSVNINGKTYSNESFTITLPKANLDSAGVMSSEDKQTLQDHGNSISQLESITSGHTNAISQINDKLDEHTESINAKITTDRIKDGAVTTEKIATSAFDDTLSVSGKIAPADVVGEKLTELERDVTELTFSFPVIAGNANTIIINEVFPAGVYGIKVSSLNTGNAGGFNMYFTPSNNITGSASACVFDVERTVIFTDTINKIQLGDITGITTSGDMSVTVRKMDSHEIQLSYCMEVGKGFSTKLYSFFVNGTLAQGNYSQYRAQYRICMADFGRFDRDIKISANSGYKFFVALYDDNKSYISDTVTWVNEYTIQANTYFKLMVTTSNDNANLSVTDGVANINISTLFDDKVKELTTKTDDLDKKIVYLVGWTIGTADGVTKVGDVVYNAKTRKLRICTSYSPMLFADLPFRNDAIYRYKDDIYIYNGIDLVRVNEKEIKSISNWAEYIIWGQGVYSVDSDALNGNNTRICSRDVQYANDDVRISVSSTKAYYLFYFNADGTYLSTPIGNWQTDDYTIPKGTYYRICLSYRNDAQIGTNDFEGLYLYQKNERFDVDSEEEIVINQDYLESILENGTIVFNSDGWTNSAYKNTSRLRTSKPIKLQKGLVISFPNKYRIYVGWRVNGVYSNCSEWHFGNFVCQEDGEYMLMISTYNDIAFTETISKVAHSICIDKDYKVCAEMQVGMESIARNGFDISELVYPPEQHIESYELAYKMGFRSMLCDVQWTSDLIPVALHDTTINAVARMSDGSAISESVTLAQKTFNELSEYDFGIIKGQKYRGLNIMKVEEFVLWCKFNNCKCYLEIKNNMPSFSEQQLESLVKIVKNTCMEKETTFILDSNIHAQIHETFPLSGIGIVCTTTENLLSSIPLAKSVKDGNEVFLYLYGHVGWGTIITDEVVSSCAENGVGIGLTECKDTNNYLSFFANKNNSYSNRIAIRTDTFSTAYKKNNLK